MRRIFVIILCISLLCIPARAEEPEKCVALTFDDGPSGRFTRALLNGLAEREVTATFLLCGYRMEQYQELTQRIVDEGHEIGLHGYSHSCLSTMCLADIQREISDCMQLLPADYRPVFLRPPGGKVNAAVRQAAQEAELAILNWDVDPRDWATHNAAAVEKAVLDQVQDGDVILLHDMSDSSVEAALVIVDALLEKGYRFVTASELARIKGITPQPGEIYNRFR